MVKEEKMIVKEVLRQIKRREHIEPIKHKIEKVIWKVGSPYYFQKIYINNQIDLDTYIDYLYVLIMKKINRRVEGNE